MFAFPCLPRNVTELLNHHAYFEENWPVLSPTWWKAQTIAEKSEFRADRRQPINLFTPDDLPYPIMRLGGLRDNFAAVVLHIKAKSLSQKRYYENYKLQTPPVLDQVITIVRVIDRDCWYVFGGNDIRNELTARHYSGCRSRNHSTCFPIDSGKDENAPSSRHPINPRFLVDLLQREDPDFQLDGRVPKSSGDLEENADSASKNDNTSSSHQAARPSPCALWGRCLLLTFVTPALQTVFAIANIVYRLLRLLSFANFWTESSESPQNRCLNDLYKIALSILAPIGLEMAALYGIVNPKAGHDLYNSIEKRVYGQALLSSL